MRKIIDLAGQRFGRLLVLEKAKKNKTEKIKWKCRCDCGNERVVLAASLRGGKTKSCGCLLKEGSHKTHGKSHTPEYKIWAGMIQRCTNPKTDNYKHYGGRGITVCERWRNSFEAFYEDMGHRPSKLHSVERINNDGNYEPDNCKWATKRKQSQNQQKRKDNKSKVKGVSYKKENNKWCAQIQHDYKRIHLGYFNSIEDAIAARRQGEIKHWNKEGGL